MRAAPGERKAASGKPILVKFFATCARGLEKVLADELRALRADGVEPGRGGVRFQGDLSLLYRANLWLRTAVRVLMPILEAPVQSPDDLYAAVQSIDWSHFMTPAHTLAVDCNVRDSAITHSKYAALRVKDAICDQFVAKVGKRPSVDVETPMVGLNLHIYQDEAVLSLDSSGESLHKRGYREMLTKAPLNAARAAGLVLLTGWRGDVPLVDPMCGSGTLCIEAAWIALKRPPGLTRRRFGFMGWMNYDVALWTELRDEARRQVGTHCSPLPTGGEGSGVRGRRMQLPAPIVGSDARRDAIHFSQAGAKAAGIGHLLTFTQRDLCDFTPPDGPPGILICNPPYGERIGDEKDLKGLYRTLGEVFRERCPGWTMWVFTGNTFLARQIGKPAQVIDLFNGKIPCRFLRHQN
ncbi:MAG: RNA methyltransferase [Planctomycetes bacterium]|nr:RNA methyltransferase [Planctomycetota bacterium]